MKVALQTASDFGLDVEDSAFGLGDVFVQPVWLGWGGKHWAAAFGYRFEPTRATAPPG